MSAILLFRGRMVKTYCARNNVSLSHFSCYIEAKNRAGSHRAAPMRTWHKTWE